MSSQVPERNDVPSGYASIYADGSKFRTIKNRMDVSPYLSAIQAVRGSKPSDKYRELGSIASRLVANDAEREEFARTNSCRGVEPSLLAHLRILVGDQLRSKDAVVEALKSDDVGVTKRALGADWFFDPSNELLDPDYLAEHVIPFVSVRTRLELIKTLARRLANRPRRAEALFGHFASLYGQKQALPLVASCGEPFIRDAIIERRVVLPTRILRCLYRKYPGVVIRYLHLFAEVDHENGQPRDPCLANLDKFLPILVKDNTGEFVQLYKLYRHAGSGCHLKLGNTRAEFFLKNAPDELVRDPKTFLDILPLKLVCKRLGPRQFETMFGNLFPRSADDLRTSKMIGVLKYYPEDKRWPLLASKYESLYGKEFPVSASDFRILCDVLPVDVKEKWGRSLAEDHCDNVHFLPPQLCVPVLKGEISKPSEKPRSHWINRMIESCSLYGSKSDLFRVLEYYNARHKNEQAQILHSVLESVTNEFGVEILDDSHWQVLKDIMQRAHVKNELLGMSSAPLTKLINAALKHFYKQCQRLSARNDDKVFLDRLVILVLEIFLERNDHMLHFTYCTAAREIPPPCLKDILSMISQKYPETHDVWNENNMKTRVIPYLAKMIHDNNVARRFNDCGGKSREKEFVSTEKSKLQMKDYPWLVKCIKDILRADGASKGDRGERSNTKQLKKMLRAHDPEFYQGLIDGQDELANDVESDDAVLLLKRDPGKVLNKWEVYHKICRDKLPLKSVKYFIRQTKWHNDIPMRFVEKSLSHIDEEGNAIILGILLEGGEFNRAVDRYLPKDDKINLNDDDTRRVYKVTSSLPSAMTLTNPPVPLQMAAAFCRGDYVSLAGRTLPSVAQRTPANRVLAFANELLDKPIAAKKLGIRLIYQVGTENETRRFLWRLWDLEKNASMRELVAKMMFDTFAKSPSASTWGMMKICINNLTSVDKTVLEFLKNSDLIHETFVAAYVKEVVKKLDEIQDKSFNEAYKLDFISQLVTNLSARVLNQLPEDLLTSIVERVFFNLSPQFLHEKYFTADEDAFESRLGTLMEILRRKIQSSDEPQQSIIRKVEEFLSETVSRAVAYKNKGIGLKVVDSGLKLFSTVLQSWHQLQSYISLQFCKNYLEVETPEQFGLECGKNIVKFVEEFGSEIIITDIAIILNRLLDEESVFENTKKLISKRTVIEGLMKIDQRVGSLVGIEMVNQYRAFKYCTAKNTSSEVEEYIGLIKTWRSIDDLAVKFVLSRFNIERYVYGM